ncbi:MAG: Eco57I restriction-modification methylase domain-containing protein [Chitinophagales bacterium]|nr:Eco57I restriction-modification methylase domain-containing protein [Chitinophagales bacterium]
MKLEFLNPTQKLKASIQKQNLKREQIELFKSNIKSTFTNILESEKRKESEEHLKVILRDFLLDTYYKGKNAINTKERKDLVIHNGSELTSSAGVLIETKQPSNKSEMISAKNPNSKSFQQLISYYIHERFINENKEIKHLIITNIYEWYIFDASDFERYFFENKKLRDSYKSWNDGNIGFNKTDWFYKEVVHPHLEQNLESISCTYFNLKDYEQVIFNNNLEDDEALLDLYKILSPEHLLKKQTANDSNSLNDKFYKELLHIVGIEEVKEGSKKTIQRCKVPNDGSLLENALNKLKKDFRDISDTEEQYSIALELCITWLNRILFLKLLEGQLIKYNHSLDFAFLSYDKIKDYDELEELFFEVLAENYQDRSKSVNEQFGNIPYLNSSLFEKTELEKKYFGINVLKDRLDLPSYDKTVLRPDGYRDQVKGSSKRTLEYLFEFLNAYDFGDVSKGKIKEESKTIINASVLGLIFEKINGYKDGSFYTPSFITMHMCRESIRRAVIQKFNESYHWNCNDFKDLYNKLDKISIQEANSTINNLHICDPAVGSGHFLVSALNEMIAIKSDLEILADKDFKRIKGYKLEIENDELIIKDEEGKLYEYNPKNAESRRIQETLFHEKQTIIENCLFGVDINPKSVMICRLRLWIELLKNAYYTESSKYKYLETLPNIDINIKCGNSLISRFEVKDSVFENIPNFQTRLKEYTTWVQVYKGERDKSAKAQLVKKIDQFKSEFKLRDKRTDKVQNEIDKVTMEILKSKNPMFPLTDIEKAKVKDYEAKLEKLTQEKKDIESNPIYQNAFEWRFEFPEVLDENGGFIGFDVVIGNPPYISTKDMYKRDMEKDIKYFNSKFISAKSGNYDIYILFIEKGFELLKKDCNLNYIIPNKFLIASYSNSLLNFLSSSKSFDSFIDISNINVFEEASVYPIIINLSNNERKSSICIKQNVQLIDNSLKINYINDWDFIKMQYVKSEENSTTEDLIFHKVENIASLNDSLTYSPGINGFQFTNYGNCISEGRKTASDKRVIVTGSIDRYVILNNKTRYKGTDYIEPFITYNKEVISEGKWELFSSPKILVAGMTKNIEATLDIEGILAPAVSVYSILGEIEILKSVLAILNSKLIDWYFKIKFKDKHLAGGYISLNTQLLSKVPICKKINQNINTCVDKILSLKKSNPDADTSELEAEIDKLVYELYGLSEEEIAVIENKSYTYE